MTIAEAQYLKDYIDSKLNETFSKLSQKDVDTLKARTFADRHMVGITGQQMLPQEVFRTFLSEVSAEDVDIEGVVGLSEALAGKAALEHTHPITDIEGLDEALDEALAKLDIEGIPDEDINELFTN